MMAGTPALVVISLAVALGAWLGVQYLMGHRNNRMLVALHFILGIAGLELLVMLLHGTPGGAATPAGSYGRAAILALALAMLSGLLVPLIAKPRPGAIGLSIALHATVATLGFGLVVLFAFG